MQNTKEMKVSGRLVLITLVTFFVVIASVNALMATLAIRTFGGVEADNAYRAGLDFARELAAARSQQARNLQVDMTSSRVDGGKTRFRLTVANLETIAGSDLRVSLDLRHPADKRHDHAIILSRQLGNSFVGDVEIEPGQWNVRISIERGGERLFRSVNRMTIP